MNPIKLLFCCIFVGACSFIQASDKATRKAQKKAARAAQAAQQAKADNNAHHYLISGGYINPNMHPHTSFMVQMQIRQHNANQKKQ